MFKEMFKVTETDCFDSCLDCKLSKSHLALEKRSGQVNFVCAQEGPNFGNYYTDTV
jgi:hypothetical protein